MTPRGWTVFVFVYLAAVVSLQADGCPERWLFALGQECVESCPRHNGSSLPYFGNATSGSCEQLSPGFGARLSATQFFANISIGDALPGSTVINFSIIIDPQDINPTTLVRLTIDSSGVAGSLLDITNNDFLVPLDYAADEFFYSDHEVQFISTPSNSSLMLSFEIVLEVFVTNVPPNPNEEFDDRSVGQVEVFPPIVPTPRDIDPPILFSSIEAGTVACPGLTIVFTCSTVNAAYLNWTVVTADGQISELSLNLNSLPQNQTSVDGFVVTILSETNSSGGFYGNLTSTLVVTANTALDGSVVECSNEQHSMNRTILIVGTLSQPVNVSYSIVNGSEKAFVLVEWNQSPNDRDAPLDQLDYMIHYSYLGSNATVITSKNTSIVLELLTNFQYNISIAAANCAGIGDEAELQIYIVGCGDPTPPLKGELETFIDSVEGSVVYYQCQSGLTPTGRMESVCLSDGSWLPEPSTLVCQADCGMPTPPVNGTLGLLNGTVEGSVVTYQCTEGLRPVGEREAVCREDGKWTPNPMDLSCTEIVVCGSPPVPDGGHVMLHSTGNTSEGAEATVHCNQFTTVCTGMGVWDPDPQTAICNVSTTQQPSAQSSCTRDIGLSVSLSAVSGYLLGVASMAVPMWLLKKKPSKVVPDSTVALTFYPNPSAMTEPVRVVEEGEV